MKNNLLLFVLFLFVTVFSIVAQNKTKTITLEWNKSATIISIKNNKNINIPLLKDNKTDQNLLPLYSNRWHINSNTVISSSKLTNIIFENFDLNKIPKALQQFIPKKINYTLFSTYERDTNYLMFSLTPFVFSNGSLKRMISFNIEYILTQKKRDTRDINTVHNSPLASGTWYKFAISQTGIHKIDSNFLQNLGINTNDINPKNIRVFGNGGAMLNERNGAFRYDGLQENAVFVKGEEDNTFNEDDYVLFYGLATNVWSSNTNTNIATHQKNVYSDKAYYFISVDNGLGKRITNQTPLTGTSDNIITTFNDYKVWENDVRNLDNFGQEFFGENFSIENEQLFPFQFADIDTSKEVKIRLKAAAIARTSSTPNPSFEVSIASQPVFNFNITSLGSSTTIIANGNTGFGTTIVTTNQFDVKVNFNNQGIPSTEGFLDYIEINATRNLIARDKQFAFRNFEVTNANPSSINEYVIENNTAIFQVWNVTDHINPKKITGDIANNTFNFKENGGELNEYIILNNTNYYTPEILTNNALTNQNLHSIRDIDYLIITTDNLVQPAKKLANYHQQNSNLSTLVLTEKTIYNEFSSGAKDATAIRDFIHHLYVNASSPNKKIKYVAFLGDTSFDFRNIEGNNTAQNTIAYQSKNSFSLVSSYVTDDFFAMMDDNEGDFSTFNGSGNLLDIAIGRIPVKNLNEANNAVDKIISYHHKKALGDWRNQISLVADDVTRGEPSEILLVEQIEQTADFIKQYKPVYNLKKIYADAFVQEISAGGESYPQVNLAINDAVERGSLVLDYFGHGGENGWANERILDVPQINNWYNPNTLPLFITITCEFSRYDNPQRTTAGEYVFNNKEGGATAMITTSREVYIHVGGPLNIELMGDLLGFNDTNEDSISQSLAKTKNNNAFEVQRLFIAFFGDPAMRLAKPKPSIKITKMNDVDVTTSLDSIKALSHVSFEGIVTQNNVIDPTFNGELSVTIYDKSVDRTTLNNDNNNDLNAQQPMEFPFDVRESKIFKGKASVENGTWRFDFIAPRDIRIAYGQAKLSFYAENQILDKNGYNTDVIIGGINENAPDDTVGPTIKLYMNDESFIDGGNTNESPLFLAILEDESGINMSLTAVDHDIVGILDGDQSNPIIMNDYYQTELNDYKKGKVKYPFRNLPVGPHTITFKCWDTYNNPSTATINFVVVSDADLVLDNVLNYPNPFINYTEFWFNHNKPNEALEAQIQVFTVSGKLIKTINKTIQTNGTLSRSITWNGLDDFGNKIGKGVYIYKLNVKTITTGIKAEKIEKLVILQ